jgi:Predicted integral membrane protein
MGNRSSIRTILFLWLAWAIILVGFQQIVTNRLTLKMPDYALSWTPGETTASSNLSRPTLLDPYLNTQVSWDSEFYLSIAINGYDDPAVRRAPNPGNKGAGPSLNYAFMPLYSLLIRGLALPFGVFGLDKIATATLAGVLVSLLGALAGMWGIYILARDRWGEEGGIRAAFYLLIFPSGFYLAQIYTEGVFIGLTFASLAFLHQRKWLWAALLAAASIWARPGEGLILLVPLVWIWIQDRTWRLGWKAALARAAAVLTPLASYLIWAQTQLARNFWLVERNFFSRGLLKVDFSMIQWLGGFAEIFGKNHQAAVYYGLELATILLALFCIGATLRHFPELALFSLGILVFTFTSGAPQGMIRYLLAAPSIFVALAGWGRRPAVDRAWTIASLLLMGMLVTLYSFNFWVA